MKAVCYLMLSVALAGCQKASLETATIPSAIDVKAELATAKAKLADLLPRDMVVNRAELLELDKGEGILLHASPKDKMKAHPSFAILLWPNGNPKDIPYETGEGAHAFRRIGSSESFRVYYSNVSSYMREQIEQAFCTKEKR